MAEKAAKKIKGTKKTVYVTKFDGSRQPFERWKVMRTCMRMGASEQAASEIVDRVESNLYDGIRTKTILRMVFKYMKKYKPEVGHEIDLREAISLLRSKPDFEKFVAFLLEEQGYSVKTNQFVEGECITHEIDAIATRTTKRAKTTKAPKAPKAPKGRGKGKEVLYVEVKHHTHPHTFTGVEVALETHARFLDMQAGRRLGKNKIRFTGAMLITNTKLSQTAERYAEHKNILHIGWNCPKDYGLERLVEELKLYPITFLKDVDKETAIRLADNGVILLRQLARVDTEKDTEKLSERVGVPQTKLKNLKAKAEEILKGSK